MEWKKILFLVSLIVLILFTVQNYPVVEIHFLLWKFEASRALVIFTTFALGVACGWGLSFLRKRWNDDRI